LFEAAPKVRKNQKKSPATRLEQDQTADGRLPLNVGCDNPTRILTVGEKQLKYASLVANAVMLSNVADLTEVLTDMAKDGHPVTPELALLRYTRSR
jgi:Tn3 transposase DDE domain